MYRGGASVASLRVRRKKIEPFNIKGVTGLTEKISDEKYKMLRENGITTFVELGPNKVFGLMGGGYSSDRSSGEAVRSSDFWNNRVHLIEKDIINNIGSLVSYFDEVDSGVGYDFILKLLWITGTVNIDEEYTFMEMNSKMILQYNIAGRYFRICEPAEVLG